MSNSPSTRTDLGQVPVTARQQALDAQLNVFTNTPPPSPTSPPDHHGTKIDTNGKSGESVPSKEATKKQRPLTSREHFNLTYKEIKFLGAGDNGNAYAAIAKSSLAKIRVKHHDNFSPDFFDDVRACMVVVKFAKDDNLEGDLTNEIEFLTQHFTPTSGRLSHAIDAHLDGDCQWLAMPFCAGGDLSNLLDDLPTAISMSFRWHIAAQLAEALLFMYFGVNDANTAPATPPAWAHHVIHGDLFAGNTLLVPRSIGFPDLVVADFGRARSLEHEWGDHQNKRIARLRFQHSQCSDINFIGIILNSIKLQSLSAARTCGHDGFGSKIDQYTVYDDSCTQCEHVVSAMLDPPPETEEDLFQSTIEQLMSFGTCRPDFADAYNVLVAFIKAAKTNMARTFEPLDPEVVEYFSAKKMSDEMLKKSLGLREPARTLPAASIKKKVKGRTPGSKQQKGTLIAQYRELPESNFRCTPS